MVVVGKGKSKERLRGNAENHCLMFGGQLSTLFVRPNKPSRRAMVWRLGEYVLRPVAAVRKCN